MFDRNLLKLPGMHGVMMALALLTLLQAAAIVGQAAFLCMTLSNLWSGIPIGQAVSEITGFFASLAILHLVKFAQETMLDRYAMGQAARLRGQLLGAVFDERRLIGAREGLGAVATAATDGIDQVQTYIRIIPPKIIALVLVSFPVLAFVYLNDWPSGVILTVMFPVIIFFMIMLGRQARARAERQFNEYTRLSNRFMDTLRGLPVLKSFGAAETEGAEVYSFSEKLRRATVRTLTTATLSSVVLDLCAMLGVAGVAMMLAFRLIDGSISLYTGLLALVLAPEFFSPIRGFGADFHASLDGKNALAAILDMIGEKTAGDAPVDTVDAVDTTETALEDVRSLEFSDVSYSYDEGTGGVRNLNFELQGGRTVVVIGASGSGKSTLANLIAGFAEPDDGTILVNGSPADLNSPAWKSVVRYIPQHPYIFRATLADNIRFYNPSASRAEIERAAGIVGLSDLVAQLPEGLDTVVGEGARGLSGGQSHRIALARILLDDRAKVLVLDEPTAHLDIETELDLKEQMLPVFEDKLVVLATHRMHWTRNADVVVELADGAVKGISGRVPENAAQVEERISPVAAENGEAPATAPQIPDEGPGTLSTADARPSVRRLASKFISRYKRSVAIALVLGLIAAGCGALLMFAAGYLVSATAVPGITLFAIMVPIAFVQIFGIVNPVAHYLERLVSHDWVLKVTSDLRLALYRGIERRTGDPARARAAGEYLGMLQDDIGHLQNLYLRVTFPTIVAILLSVGTAIVFGIFSAPFGLLMLAILAVLVFALPLAALRVTRPTTERFKARKSDEYASVTDDIMGAVDWILSGRRADVTAGHARADAELRALDAHVGATTRGFVLAVTLLLGAVSCLVIAWAAVTFGTPGTSAADLGAAGSDGAGLPVHWIAAFTLGFFPLIESVATVSASATAAPVHEDAVIRLDGYLEEAPQATVDEGAKPAPTPSSAATGDATAQAEPLVLQDVTYAYPGAGRPALDAISLSIPQGQSVAVLGASGSGKTTLAQVACGNLVAEEGLVTIGGIDAQEMAGAIPEHIGFIGQQPYLFNRTLRENLTLGVLEADDTRLVSVLGAVGLDGKLASLPNGLDTVVGETGIGFSGGEAHRIALARVLVADTPIVIVDEPFSALDPETEHALIDTLFEACKDRTLVVITHHLAEIERFDRVVFVENGRIALDGSPAELAESSSRFCTLMDFDRAS